MLGEPKKIWSRVLRVACASLVGLAVATTGIATGAPPKPKQKPKPGNYTAVSTERMRISFKVEPDGTVDRGFIAGGYGGSCAVSGTVGSSSEIDSKRRFRLGERGPGQLFMTGRFIDRTHVRGMLTVDESEPGSFCQGVYKYAFRATTLKPPK